jgi:hypothetical protein
VAWAGALVNTLLVLVVHPLVQDLSASDDGPRPRKVDIPAFVRRIQNSPPSSLGSVAAIRSHLQSTTIRRDALASTTAATGVTSAILLASYIYFVAQWYVGHLFASAQTDRVSQDGSQVVLPATPTAPVHVTSASAAIYPSPAFWVEDEGEPEIWKKVD